MGKYADKVKNFVETNQGNLNWTNIRNFLLSLGSRQAYCAAKKEFEQFGINVDALQSEAHSKIEAERGQRIKTQRAIKLYTDAAISMNKFGICDENENPVWFGIFFENDYVTNQAEAELEAAKKAVWLAGKVAETLNERITLFLNTDAEWLLYQDNPSQKGYVLTQMARKYNIDLVVSFVRGKENPADKYSRMKGYQKYDLNKVVKLVDYLDNETDVA